jgi:hypothetical protein
MWLMRQEGRPIATKAAVMLLWALWFGGCVAYPALRHVKSSRASQQVSPDQEQEVEVQDEDVEAVRAIFDKQCPPP